MSFGFVFAGQGSQSVGMLASLAPHAPVRATFDEASVVLGYDLKILPVFMEFEKHAEMTIPLDKFDTDAAANRSGELLRVRDRPRRA